MAKDTEATEAVRTFENRLVWFVSFVVALGTRGSMATSAAKIADQALDEYQTRHPAFEIPAPE